VALTTPVPLIVLAMEGKIDFVLKTNPFGGGGDSKQGGSGHRRVNKQQKTEPNRNEVADKIKTAFRGMMARKKSSAE